MSEYYVYVRTRARECSSGGNKTIQKSLSVPLCGNFLWKHLYFLFFFLVVVENKEMQHGCSIRV